jgi:hypothetical protein
MIDIDKKYKVIDITDILVKEITWNLLLVWLIIMVILQK